MNYKDRFSQGSDAYRQYRPLYPSGLFAALAELCGQHDLAWDCACGNGQAAVALAPYFEQVVATDASAAQLQAAEPVDNVRYLAAPAESVPLPGHSVDLITVAQALHWFDLSAFFAECQRVLKPGAVLAVWSYNLLSVSAEVDKVVGELYWEYLGSYWDPERKLVEEGYASVEFPFQRIEMAPQTMAAQWTLDHLLGYLRTWSAVKRYQQQCGSDPVVPFEDALARAWGSEEQREIHWPLALHVGRFE